jgi:hypothetical protein
MDQLLHSELESEERIIAVYAVFKPNTIDAGWDARFAGAPDNTETGQFAGWYTRRSGQIEHLTYNEIPAVMDNVNGPDARKEIIYDPVPQTVAGGNTFTVKISAPIINRWTNEVVGRVGINVDTAYTQPVVDATINNNTDITAMTIYSNNGTIIASGAPNQVGRLLNDAQKVLFSGDAGAAFDVYGDVVAEDFLPAIYSPVSLATQNPDLEPLISVVQKAMRSGASFRLSEMYSRGYEDYLDFRHKWIAIEEEAKKAGVDMFLPKPVFSSGIVDRINECLAKLY